MNDSKILFFFGAGASVPAGIKGVVGPAQDYRKWLEDTSKSNESIVFLISPSAYSVYEQKLKIHQDYDSKKTYMSSCIPDNSTLSGRVICLNYGIENIISHLSSRYLITLRQAQDAERVQREHQIRGENTKWNDCIKYYVDCEYIERANKIIEEGEWSRFVSDDWKWSFEISLKGLLTSLLDEKDDIIIIWRQYLKRVLKTFSFENFVFNPDLGMQTSSFPAHIDLEFRIQGSNIPSHELAQTLGLLIHVMEDKLQLIKGDKKHKKIIEFLGRESKFFGKLVKLIQYFNPWSDEKMTFQDYLDRRQPHTNLIAQLKTVMKDFETNTSIQNRVGQLSITEIVRQIELVEIREIYGSDTLAF